MCEYKIEEDDFARRSMQRCVCELSDEYVECVDELVGVKEMSRGVYEYLCVLGERYVEKRVMKMKGVYDSVCVLCCCCGVDVNMLFSMGKYKKYWCVVVFNNYLKRRSVWKKGGVVLSSDVGVKGVVDGVCCDSMLLVLYMYVSRRDDVYDSVCGCSIYKKYCDICSKYGCSIDRCVLVNIVLLEMECEYSIPIVLHAAWKIAYDESNGGVYSGYERYVVLCMMNILCRCMDMNILHDGKHDIDTRHALSCGYDVDELRVVLCCDRVYGNIVEAMGRAYELCVCDGELCDVLCVLGVGLWDENVVKDDVVFLNRLCRLFNMCGMKKKLCDSFYGVFGRDVVGYMIKLLRYKVGRYDGDMYSVIYDDDDDMFDSMGVVVVGDDICRVRVVCSVVLGNMLRCVGKYMCESDDMSKICEYVKMCDDDVLYGLFSSKMCMDDVIGTHAIVVGDIRNMLCGVCVDDVMKKYRYINGDVDVYDEYMSMCEGVLGMGSSSSSDDDEYDASPIDVVGGDVDVWVKLDSVDCVKKVKVENEFSDFDDDVEY